MNSDRPSTEERPADSMLPRAFSGVVPVWETSVPDWPQIGYKTVPVFLNEDDVDTKHYGKVPTHWPVTALVWINGKLHPKSIAERTHLAGLYIEAGNLMLESTKTRDPNPLVMSIPDEDMQSSFSYALATMGFVRRLIPRSGYVYWLFKTDANSWLTFKTHPHGPVLGLFEGRRHRTSVTALSVLNLEPEEVQLLINDPEEGAPTLGLSGEIKGLCEEFGRVGAQAVQEGKLSCSK